MLMLAQVERSDSSGCSTRSLVSRVRASRLIRCERCSCCLFSCSLWSAERWQMQYFFDQEQGRTSVHSNCVLFADTRCCHGRSDVRRRNEAASVVTSDSGAHWTLTPTQEMRLLRCFFSKRPPVGW